MKGTYQEIEDIEHKHEMLGFETDKWLRKRGWDRTCSFPNSCWYWTKTVDKEVYITDKDTALSMETAVAAGEQD